MRIVEPPTQPVRGPKVGGSIPNVIKLANEKTSLMKSIDVSH